MKKIRILLVLALIISTVSLSFAQDDTVSITIKDDTIITQLNEFISAESNNENVEIFTSKDKLKASDFYSHKNNDFVQIYNLTQKLSDYSLIDSKTTTEIMENTLVSYYTLLVLDDGTKAALRFLITDDGILEHGYIGIDDSFLKACYDDQFIKKILIDQSIKKFDKLKMVDFIGYNFKGLYVEADNNQFIIPFFNESKDLSNYELFTKYEAQEILNKLKDLSISNTVDNKMGGYSTRHDSMNYTIWVLAGLFVISLFIFLFKRKQTQR
ncbi:hypothetical protein [Fusibacter sp. 3D3]|uniref:hypothetical protein n=1 Tax=Fusibacter sp. 3D3 TaxID=1048380 RepID=UPI000855F500|nr:hypothetical protein [Fusibacter sp. 3D3]GAU79810.1 hypothetical protein F3D3_4475 [Fusibacter sp. 3D3]